MSDYQISEADIDAMIVYLKNHHQEQANREFAESFLRYMKDQVRNISINNLENDSLDKLYKAFSIQGAEQIKIDLQEIDGEMYAFIQCLNLPLHKKRWTQTIPCKENGRNYRIDNDSIETAHTNYLHAPFRYVYRAKAVEII